MKLFWNWLVCLVGNVDLRCPWKLYLPLIKKIRCIPLDKGTSSNTSRYLYVTHSSFCVHKIKLFPAIICTDFSTTHQQIKTANYRPWHVSENYFTSPTNNRGKNGHLDSNPIGNENYYVQSKWQVGFVFSFRRCKSNLNTSLKIGIHLAFCSYWDSSV